MTLLKTIRTVDLFKSPAERQKGEEREAWSDLRWDHVYLQQKGIFVSHEFRCQKYLQKMGCGPFKGWK